MEVGERLPAVVPPACAAVPVTAVFSLDSDELTMRAVLISCILFAATAHPAMANEAEIVDLAKANGCFSCHSAQEKIVGPAFRSVAAKYAGDKDAVATLTQSIRQGSSGKWGRAAMPAHSSLDADDLKKLASWVMATKP